MKKHSALSCLILLLVTASFLGFFFRKENPPQTRESGSPLAIPTKGNWDSRFHLLSAWQKAQIPRATRFSSPMGSAQGAFTYNAQAYWEMNTKRGGHHTGDDINGIGGMNSDLGDPVHAAADGLVIYTGDPSPGWGNIVILAHHTATGELIHSMYAHMQSISVSVNQIIPRGGKIGSVGTGNNHYPAHLHFEMRASDGADIGGGYSMLPLNHLDPAATMKKFHLGNTDDLSESLLR